MTERAEHPPAVQALDEDRVYRQHYARVYRLALSLSGHPSHAEDIAQDTFLAVFGGLGRFRAEAALSTWIYRITVRTATRWMARQRPTETLPDEVRAIPDGIPLDLIRAMQHLSVANRTVLLLVAVEGLTHREAGEVLGVPEGTIASRVHSARKQLSARLRLR